MFRYFPNFSDSPSPLSDIFQLRTHQPFLTQFPSPNVHGLITKMNKTMRLMLNFRKNIICNLQSQYMLLTNWQDKKGDTIKVKFS